MSSMLYMLTVPTDQGLHAALGRMAMAHTQLELILRYCVKSIAGLQVEEALDATEGMRLSDLRRRIQRLFAEKKPTEGEKTQLDAILGRAKRLSEKRNDYLHRAWSQTQANRSIIKGSDHRWDEAPSVKDIDDVAEQILELSHQLNLARNGEGFIAEVV